MRSTIRRLAFVPGTVLAAGALVLGMATAAGASVSTTNWAGYRAGNGNWHFRYVQGTFTVPQNACTTDDYQTSGVHLGGSIDYFNLGVTCNSSSSTGLSGFYSYDNGATSGVQTGPIASTQPGADDVVFASLYYDQETNLVNLYEYDETAGVVLWNTWFNAGTDMFKYATVFGTIDAAQPDGPEPGQSITLVPFTQVRVTALNGTRGVGIDGPWGVSEEMAVSGAHTILAGTNLSNGWSSFDVTEYGNA